MLKYPISAYYKYCYDQNSGFYALKVIQKMRIHMRRKKSKYAFIFKLIINNDLFFKLFRMVSLLPCKNPKYVEILSSKVYFSKSYLLINYGNYCRRNHTDKINLG